MNDFATSNKALCRQYPRGYWPASTLRVISLDDLETDIKVTDIQKLFPSESFSSCGDDSFLTPFEYDTSSSYFTANDTLQNDERYMNDEVDKQSSSFHDIPKSIYTSKLYDDKVGPFEVTSEGIGVIPLPDDCLSVGSLESDTEDLIYDPLTLTCDGLWNTDPFALVIQQQLGPFEVTSEGIGVIPLPDDCSSVGSLESDTDDLIYDPLTLTCDGLWNTDPFALVIQQQHDPQAIIHELSVTSNHFDCDGTSSSTLCVEEPDWGWDLSFQDFCESVVVPWKTHGWQCSSVSESARYFLPFELEL